MSKTDKYFAIHCDRCPNIVYTQSGIDALSQRIRDLESSISLLTAERDLLKDVVEAARRIPIRGFGAPFRGMCDDSCGCDLCIFEERLRKLDDAKRGTT